MLPKWTCIILAAGLGTRMKSSLPKVLHPICGKPLVNIVVEKARAIGIERIIVVIGHGADLVRKSLENIPNVEFVVQEQQLGTGHAVKTALDKAVIEEDYTMILSADVPLLNNNTLSDFVKQFNSGDFIAALISAEVPDPSGYGRILRDSWERLRKIVEDKDADSWVKTLKEINSGIYCFKTDFLKKAVEHLRQANAQHEFYLTDLIDLGYAAGKDRIFAKKLTNEREIMGMNNRIEQSQLERERKKEINKKHMLQGVTLIDHETTYIEDGVIIENDVVIHPGVTLRGKTLVQGGTEIENGTIVKNSKIGKKCKIFAYSYVDESEISDETNIGPFARLRPGTKLGRHVKIGNFVEVKNVVMGDDSKASHLAYLGDAKIGKDVNIGCGVITCNYDGKSKNRTTIGDDVFVGSDCQFIAPVEVKRGSYIASGSTITDNVPEDSFAIARSRQTTKEGYAKKYK